MSVPTGTIENAEGVRRRASIVLCGGLRRHRTLARQAEPRICAVTPEFGRSQFDNFQRRLDRKGDLACRAARRTHFAWRAFGAANQTQPQATWRKYGSDLCRELLPLVWFIEHVKATAVEHELERPVGRTARSSTEFQSLRGLLNGGRFDSSLAFRHLNHEVPSWPTY
jgi:hypothetical protein